MLKRRILKQISREGGRLSKAASAIRTQRENFRWLRQLAFPAISFAAGAILAIAATQIVRTGNFRRGDQQRAQLAVLVASPPIAPQLTPDPGGPSGVSETNAREAALEKELKNARAREDELERQLRDARAKAEDWQQDDAMAKQQIIDLQRQLQTTRAIEGKAEAELASIKEIQTTKDVVVLTQEQEIRQLHNKLDEQSVSLTRERELMSAGREIRDLIAARNLHIIDVYDTDETGRTKKSFGRVFYTEGKSLVFYAYDLPMHGVANAKYAYYAWGKRGGKQQTIRKLGILYNDDQAQKRWVLTVTDPDVLSEIDSVFVTLEHTENSGDAPRGKKVLSTYLVGPPNHP